MYCLFPNSNGWMYVCLRSHRERFGWGSRRTRKRSPRAAVGWWRQVSIDLSLSHSLIHFPHSTVIPKDLLAFVIHVLGYLFGLDYYCLVLCYCSTLINEHDENDQWYAVFPLLIMMLHLWPLRGARAVSRVPLRKDLFVGWPPGKTVQAWGWNGAPLAE
jgi:hypothetical protein